MGRDERALEDRLATVLIASIVLSMLRRLAMTLASLLPPRYADLADCRPTVQILVAARDEERALPALFASLEELLYPREKLSFVFVSDGSHDATSEILDAWCRTHANALSLQVREHGGKAAALELARKEAQGAELTAIYDADVQPHPEALSKLAALFADPKMGVAAGSRLPSNANTNVVSRYAAVELYVFDLVIQAARRRLGWNAPASGANCVYRTAALNQIGGFPRGGLTEDIDASFALAQRGWRTSHRDDAIVTTAVPANLRACWRQRQRWTRGLYRAGRSGGFSRALVAAGYVDRLIFLGALVAAFFGRLSFAWPALYLLGPSLAILIALRRSGQAHWMAFLLACVPMFAVDVSSTVVGTLASLIPVKGGWNTDRSAARPTPFV